MLLRLPLNATPIGVRAVDTITASFIACYAVSEISWHYNSAKEKGDASIFHIFIITPKIDTPPFSIPLLPLLCTYYSKALDRSSMTVWN